MSGSPADARGPGVLGASRRGFGLRAVVALLAFAVFPALLSTPASAAAQDRLEVSDGETTTRIEITRQRGYAAVDLTALETLGWRFRPAGELRVGELAGVHRIELRPGNPFLGLDGGWVQLADAPYLFGDDFLVPLQLLTDVLPDRIPGRFEADGPWRLRLVDGTLRPRTLEAPAAEPTEAPVLSPAAQRDPTRVVVIDAGHGGDDPGAIGPSGAREKEVALEIARALFEELDGTPGLEVHMTRTGDVLVPLWERGEIATRLRGDRAGIFVSIHANALPSSRSVRGFETYFLSEARTEDERRVAALENSAIRLEGGPAASGPDPELGSILNELRNLDYQHWSADLAGRVQREMMTIHPGRDRGVKQGPLAVLTNAMMPSVLIEMGFITNPEEERLLRDPVFQRDAAREIAEAIRAFFERYPPGSQGTAGEGR